MRQIQKTIVRPIPFTAALVLSPVILAALLSTLALTSPIFLIVALASILMGSLQYVFIGGPLLYFWLQKGHQNPIQAAVLGFGLNLGICLTGAVITMLPSVAFNAGMVQFCLVFGSIFAPIWCAGFAVLYARFTHSGQ